MVNWAPEERVVACDAACMARAGFADAGWNSSRLAPRAPPPALVHVRDLWEGVAGEDGV